MDDGLVASTNPGWMQYVFDTLIGIFDRVGLWTNIRKEVGMLCKPYWAYMVHSDEAYTRKIMG